MYQCVRGFEGVITKSTGTAFLAILHFQVGILVSAIIVGFIRIILSFKTQIDERGSYIKIKSRMQRTFDVVKSGILCQWNQCGLWKVCFEPLEPYR